ncbi:MAG: alpha-amylase family glycosyl hydrolase [Caulobacteraceae bacterium]
MLESEASTRAAPESAPWWKGAAIYQVYPRSFADSNGDGVGDLAGVTAHLDYIASLGVDGVWLSPFFPSPMKDFGYDVADYLGVDPLFGTLADFDALLARAHALGLKLVIDQVYAHTSDQHPWFIDSAASRENSKADWYVWADARDDGSPPNNWQASFGGPSWTWSPTRRQYYFHNFLVEQPDLNFWSEEVQETMLGVGRFWFDRGVDGLRLDVINYIVHDRVLTDNPIEPRARPPGLPTLFQRHVHDRSRPEALAFVRRLRRLADERPGRMLVGEVVDEPPLPRQREYTRGPDRLHTAYGFHLLTARRSTPALFTEALSGWADGEGWPSWSLGNHDVARYATRLARSGDPREVRILLAALLCLRGTIFLYQGEELGLPQANLPLAALRDPFDIATAGEGAGRDGARTPMPWTAEGPSAGFSAVAETWLPVDPAHRPLAVAEQETDAGSMLHFTRRLIALRRRLPALRLGEVTIDETAPANLLAFTRRCGGEAVLCLFELGGRETLAPAPAGSAIEATFGFDGESESVALRLPPFGGAVLRLAE